MSVYFDGRNERLEAAPVIEQLKHVLRLSGELKAMWSLQHGQGHLREFHVEYFDIRAAAHATALLRDAQIIPVCPLLLSVKLC